MRANLVSVLTLACSVASVTLLILLLRKVKTMAQNDAELTSAVQELTDELTAFETQFDVEVAALATAQANQDDAAQDTAIANIKALTAGIKSKLAPVTSAPVSDPTPAPVDTTTPADPTLTSTSTVPESPAPGSDVTPA